MERVDRVMMKNNLDDVNRNCGWDATPLKWQVGGHTTEKNASSIDMMSVKGGYVLKPIIKPVEGKREIDFYESLEKPVDSIAKELKLHVPKYFGTTEVWVNERLVQCLILDDVTRGFDEPCIMDIKIGRQTWDPSAPEAKKQAERVKYAASKRDLAFCIPGYQVYDVTTKELQRFNSSYGKTLDGEGVTAVLRHFLNADVISSRNLLIQFLAKLWQILRWFRTQTQYHFFASSLLIVYDAAKLREELKSSTTKRSNGPQHRPTVARQLSLRTPKGPLTPGFETKKAAVLKISECDVATTSSSHAPGLSSPDDLNDSFDSMCKTHSLENNYEKDLESMKENYTVVLKDLLHDHIHLDSLVSVKMIDFGHAFSANCIDKNYLEGLENLVNIFEQFLMELDS